MYICSSCLNAYEDIFVAAKCCTEDCPEDLLKKGDNVSYICYLNGKQYGRGDLSYMTELFKDYVETCKMYGHESVDFKIVKMVDDEII